MQLVAEGRLELHDPLGRHLPGAPHPDIPIAALLSHTSGLQQEPVGEVWETLEMPSREDLLANAATARALYPPASWWHYSNLGFALLGELVAHTSGIDWDQYVSGRILEPLGMTRTSSRPKAPCATGYSVFPFTDELVSEQPVDLRGMAPAGQLWSTATDLATWTGFLLHGNPKVLDTRFLEQMAAPRVIADLEHWSQAWGLGLMLLRQGDRVLVGHKGSMPGFLAAAFASATTGTGVVALTNATASVRVEALAARALELVDTEDVELQPWAPGAPAPEGVAPILGRWWTEWNESVFRWRNGQLESLPVDGPPGTEPSRYGQLGPDLYVAVNGPERGEELRIVRDQAGEVLKMYRATYPFTREPEPFGSTSR
jgi:CubicO group peptidase (beta-lactamase class C family)